MDLVHTLYTRYAEELNAVKANMQTALSGVPCNAEMGKILTEIIGQVVSQRDVLPRHRMVKRDVP